MPVSKNFLNGKKLRKLADGLTDAGAIATGSAFETSVSGATGSGTAVYSTIDQLPLSNNDTGSQAFVDSDNRLYLWNGSGWYNIELDSALS